MLLFDNTAQGVLVLLGAVSRWWQGLVPGHGGGLPPYRALVIDPFGVALAALVRAAPCIGGLLLIALRPGVGAVWWWVALLWAAAAAIGGKLVAITLLPGLLAVLLLGAIDRPHRRAA